MSQRPLYWLLFIFTFGFLSAHFFISLDKAYLFLVVILVAFVCLVGIGLLRRWRISIVCLLLWMVAVGYYAIHDNANQTQLNSLSNPQLIEGSILSSVKVDGDIVKFTFRIRKIEGLSVDEKTECRVPLKSRKEVEEAHRLRVGSVLQFPSPILSIDPPRNPGAFDYKRYLYYKGIHWTLQPTSFSALSITSPGAFDIGYRLDQFQRRLAQITDQLFSPASSSMIKGLILGMRDDIPTEITDVYSKLGLVHVLAISGLHMSVIIGGLLKVGEIIGLTRETRLVVAMVFIPGYIILVGASPSVTRAGIMAVTVLIGHYLHRPRDGLNLLGAAGLVMLLYEPYQIWDIGFQLSFIVTWGLLVLAPILSQRLQALGPFFRSLLAVTLSAQLASFPIVIYYFHQFHLLSPIVNLIFVPLFSLFIIPLGFLSLVLGMIHPALSFLLATVITSLLGWIYPLLDWAARLKQLQFHFPSPPLWWMGIYYLGITLLPFLRVRKQAYLFVVCMAILLCLPLVSIKEEKVVITFLDVGQGDSIVIETPSDHVYLIDSGGTPLFYNEKDAWRMRKEPYDPGKRIVVPFLKSKGIEQIDTVFMTHGDSDHIGGMLSILKEMRVGRVVGNGQVPSTALEKELLSFIAENQIPLYWGKRGDHWQDGTHVTWRILNPDPEGISVAKNNNNQSVVLLLEVYGRRILFTGDIEKEGEQAILSSDLLVPIDVLKVGHHGSKTSTQKAWVERLEPHLSVISVGKKNRFGHPHPDTIAVLTESGSQILRTDQVGSITFEIKKEGWNITTFLQPYGKLARQEK